MYLKLMQQNNNAAALDSGMTLIAAGLSRNQGTREGLLRLAGNSGAGRQNITANDLINIQKQQQAMKDMLLRRSVLGGLAKQYGLSPEAALALETSGKLDEVIAAQEGRALEVVEDNATGQKAFYKNGKKITDIGGPKPEEGEFQEGPGGRQLISKRTGLPMGPGIGQPPKTQVVEGALGPELRDTTPGGTFAKVGGSAGLKPTEASRHDAELLDGINRDRIEDGLRPYSMEYFLTNIKRAPQQAANAADEAGLAAVNRTLPPDKQIGMREYLTTIKRENREAPNAKNEAALASINADRVSRGIAPMGMEEYVRRYGSSGVTVNVGKDGTPFPAPPPGQAYRRDGNNVLTNAEGEPQLYDLPGGDAALAREEQKTKVAKTQQDVLKGERETKASKESDIEKARSRYSQLNSVYGAAEDVEKIMKEAPFYSPATGFGSQPFTMFGSTPATNARAQLKTIDAIVAFRQLQSMRDASKTGAALGPVSDFENKMLTASIRSIDPGQSDHLILKGLRAIRASMAVLAENDFKDLAKGDEVKAFELYQEAMSKEMLRLENRDTKVKGDDVRRIK
jgi:hypothetical protein